MEFHTTQTATAGPQMHKRHYTAVHTAALLRELLESGFSGTSTTPPPPRAHLLTTILTLESTLAEVQLYLSMLIG